MASVDSLSDRIDALRRHFFGKITFEDFDRLAAAGKPGCDVLRFDFTESDFEKADGFEKHDIARAIIESAAHLLRDNLARLREIGLRADRIVAIGGITNSAVSIGIISDVMGVKIDVVNGQSAGAVGSCLLAGIGTGAFAGEREAFAIMKGRMNG